MDKIEDLKPTTVIVKTEDHKPAFFATSTYFTSNGCSQDEIWIDFPQNGDSIKKSASDVETDDIDQIDTVKAELSEEDGSMMKNGIYSLNNKVEASQPLPGVWRRPTKRRYYPVSEEPSEKLTTMSLQGKVFPYVVVTEDGAYQCTKCAEANIAKTFKHKHSFQRHAFLYHEGLRKVFPCPDCSQEFSRPDMAKRHRKTEHLDPMYILYK